jgi:hypothetical protein
MDTGNYLSAQAAFGRLAVLGLDPASRWLTKDLGLHRVVRITAMHLASGIGHMRQGKRPSQFHRGRPTKKEPPGFGRFLFPAFRPC